MPTLGERRVRTEFNPSKDSAVDQIKQKTAELIDLCSRLPGPEKDKGESAYAEFRRLMALAQTHYEDAAMWAVKAATT